MLANVTSSPRLGFETSQIPLALCAQSACHAAQQRQNGHPKHRCDKGLLLGTGDESPASTALAPNSPQRSLMCVIARGQLLPFR